MPGNWASTAFQEKVNTSLYRKSEEEVEEMAKQEKIDAREHAAEMTRLVWIAVCWVKNVAPHLEQLELEVGELKEGSEKPKKGGEQSDKDADGSSERCIVQ